MPTQMLKKKHLNKRERLVKKQAFTMYQKTPNSCVTFRYMKSSKRLATSYLTAMEFVSQRDGLGSASKTIGPKKKPNGINSSLGGLQRACLRQYAIATK